MKKEEEFVTRTKKQLESELARIKHELRAQLAKEDIKRQIAEQESQQHKEEEQKRLTIMQEREACYRQTESSRPSTGIKAQEQMSRNEDKQSTATGQEYERIQDETEEEEQRKDTERENENKTCMVNDVTSDEKRETEVQTGYRKKIHEDSMISDDTPQQDCTCSSIPYDPLNISCAQITTLEVPHNSDRQETPVDETHRVCIAQESLSDDPIQSDSAHASLSDEKLQISRAKKTNQKVHHVTDLQEKAMQRTLRMYIAEECVSDLHIPQSLIKLKILLGDSVARKIVYAAFRDIVISSKNSSFVSSFCGGKTVY